MVAVEASRAAVDARMKFTRSHGGRLVPCGPDGAPRYVGGETRVLAVPRAASFRDLAARLSSEMAGGAEVRAVRHRLTDVGLEDVIVSVTCDEELAHMRDEYDRLRANRPTAGFRVFVIATTASASGGGGSRPRRSASGLPPLAPRRRRVQSEQALPARAHLNQCPAYLTPMRRVQSAQEIAGASRLQPSVHQHQYCCGVRAPVAEATRPTYTVHYMSKNANGVRSGSHEHAPTVPTAKAAGRGVFTVAARFVAARA